MNTPSVSQLNNRRFGMVEKSKKGKAVVIESKEFLMQIKQLESIFSLDLKMIEDDRNDKEIGIPVDDPKRNEVTLKLNSFSIPFAITPKIITVLKRFFKKKGWEFVNLTSTPSIKLKKIQRKK